MVEQHAIEKLACSIFDSKDEKFHRFVKGFTGFHYGQLHAVHLLLTDKSVYFLRKQSNGGFTTEHSINFQELKHVEIGVNCQYVAFVAKNEKYSFSTANEAITRSLVTDISSLMVRGLASPAQLTRIVCSTAVQGQQAIKKWLRTALEKQVDKEVMSTVICVGEALYSIGERCTLYFYEFFWSSKCSQTIALPLITLHKREGISCVPNKVPLFFQQSCCYKFDCCL